MISATLKRRLAIGTSLLATAAFAGGAYAASKDTSANTRQAFLNDVAKRLNVSPAQLKSALVGAFDDQLQAAVTAGKITKDQADAIKQRIQANGFAPFGFGGLGLLKAGPGPLLKGAGPGPFFHGPLPFPPPPGEGRFGAAAKYLGLTPTQLLNQLQAGKSLAQIAAAQGKTVAGLKSAMTAAIKAKLDKAVAAKMITSAQEQKLLSRLSTVLDAQISGKALMLHRLYRFAGPGGPGRVFPGFQVPSGPPPLPVTVY